MGRKITLLILLLTASILNIKSFGQTPPSHSIDPETLVERLFSVPEEDLDYESIYEVLLQLYLNPLDINKADEEVLQSTYLLNPFQISSLISYRTNFGSLISLYELQAVPGFDLETIDRIIPFITLVDRQGRSQNFLNRLKNEEQAYFLLRHRRTWETRKGYTPPDTTSSGAISSRYMGDPNELYLRFRIQHARDFSIGFTLDKDPGEQFKWDPKTARYGFNFLSFHLTRYYVGKWKVISIGDFQASFGQGLVYGAGYSLGKGAETVPTIRRSSRGILPYTAALEFGFFRGLAATYQLKNFQLSLLSSFSPKDGQNETTLDSIGNEQNIITSFNQSGLHRTYSEIKTKNKFREISLGSNIQYVHHSRKFQAGSNFLLTQFDQPWVRDLKIYNKFEFTGRQNSVASIYFNYNWKNFNFFGESAMSKSTGKGTVLGLISSLSRQVDFSLLYRKYDRNFHSFFATGLSESTRPTNETGIYMGIEIRPNSFWKINAYYDYFKFPWLKFRIYAPSDGTEWLTRLTFRPSKNLSSFIQIREEIKDRNITDSGESSLRYLVAPITKRTGLISLEYRVSKSLFLRSRILMSQVDFESKKTKGYMIFQDVQYGLDKWRITSRVALFDTENYENRLYAFENNVLWTFSIPALSGQGMRYYFVGQYAISRKLTAYFRFARTSYTDRETISSGLQMINGPQQTETTLLLRYMLHR
jgi:hypothetical protein